MKPQRLDRVVVCYRIGDPHGEYPIYDSEGSRIDPGRWNTSDTPLIYASEHYSTAMLEKLVHSSGQLPPNQHFMRITIPNGTSFEVVTHDRLPTWSAPEPHEAQRFGSAWARERRSAILLVPSYVARVERNVLINLAHPESASITHELPEPVWWYERLFG